MARISILLPDLRGGGVERIRLVLAHEFQRSGHQPEFILMQAAGELCAEASSSFRVRDLDCQKLRDLPFALASYLRRDRPDALIAAMWPLTVIAPVVAALTRFPGKVLVSEHAILSRQYAPRGQIHRLILRATVFLGYRLADARVGVSSGTCADMADLAVMAPQNFSKIHNPACPASRSQAVDLQVANGLWMTDGPRVLTVGNLKSEKNHALLLRSFAAMSHPTARLMILGQGQNESALKSLASELNISDRVVFAGFQPDPSPFYASADLFVLSSDHEGFGNVIVEALSFGLPVVSTDCPSGPSEILQNGLFGRLVPVGDERALSQAMNAALDAPVDRPALIRRAACFAPDVAASKYLELLELT